MKCLIPAFVVLLSACLAAQTSPVPAAQQGAAASSPAGSVGLFVFPRQNQSAEKQLQDENGCYASAKQQSGIDPQALQAAGKTEAQKKAEQQAAAESAPQAKGGRARGAARGAAGGAAIGAISGGDAGTGAAAGAVGGTVRGGIAQRRANKAAQQQAAQQTAQKQQQQEAQAKAQSQQRMDTFRRAFSACMDARGYSVK